MTRLHKARDGRAALVERPAPLAVVLGIALHFIAWISVQVHARRMCRQANRRERSVNPGSDDTAQLAGCSV
jgi:hypothetical protein